MSTIIIITAWNELKRKQWNQNMFLLPYNDRVTKPYKNQLLAPSHLITHHPQLSPTFTQGEKEVVTWLDPGGALGGGKRSRWVVVVEDERGQGLTEWGYLMVVGDWLRMYNIHHNIFIVKLNIFIAYVI